MPTPAHGEHRFRGKLFALSRLLFAIFGKTVGLLVSLSPSGCGDESAPEGTVTIEARFEVGGREVGCDEVPAVEAVELVLFDESGRSIRPGYPRVTDCGPVEVSGPAGPNLLEVRGVGTLDGDSGAVLFAARAPISLPSAPITLRLRAEVAFLELDWNFGDRMLAPCSNEVGVVEVIVASVGAGDSTFRRRFECAGRPVFLDRAFGLAPHTVDVRAISAGDFPVYATTATRLLERGPNTYTAVLAPLGGQILLDWQFRLDSDRIDACDDPRVNVRQVRASVQGLIVSGGQTGGQTVPDGTQPISEFIDCTSARPAAFRAARFRAGRLLDLELVADGVHRFRSVERFTMPDGDALRNVSTLVAVGTATSTLSVQSSACDSASAVGFTGEVFPNGSQTPIQTVTLTGAERLFTFADLPYGDYRLTVRRDPPAAGCLPIDTNRSVGAATVDWGQVTL